MIDRFTVHTVETTKAVEAKIQIMKKGKHGKTTLKTHPYKMLHTRGNWNLPNQIPTELVIRKERLFIKIMITQPKKFYCNLT